MKVTTKDLSTSNYGTPWGSVGESNTSLSHPLVIDFIDTFFGGVLDDVDVYEDDDETDSILISGGYPILQKLTITNSEFDHFTQLSKDFKSDIIEDMSDCLDIKKSKFKDIENKIDEEQHPMIICWLFSCIVGFYGGSFRCEFMDDGNGTVELESE
jgi:hypothetical protein